MKKGKVFISADKYGNIVSVSQNNPEWGYIQVMQTVPEVNGKGIYSRKVRNALIVGKVNELLEENFQEGEELPGQIIIKESLEPFYPENPDKHLKIAGNTGIPCHVDGQPIYRNAFYTLNMDETDHFIQHTNTAEIKEAQRAEKELVTMLDKVAF